MNKIDKKTETEQKGHISTVTKFLLMLNFISSMCLVLKRIATGLFVL